jgi:hypothetical protein
MLSTTRETKGAEMRSTVRFLSDRLVVDVARRAGAS